MREKHSGLGMISFFGSCISGIGILVLFVVAGMMEMSTPGGIDENDPKAGILGLAIMLMLLGSVVSLGLGVGGLFQDNRKKVFAILGVAFSSMILLATIGLIVIGLLAE